MEMQLANPDVPPGEDDPSVDACGSMDTEEIWQQRHILAESLQIAWKDRHDRYVAGNMALYFSARQVKRNDFRVPDDMVILDTTDHIRPWWVVWQEERTPDVVIELLSPATEDNDRGKKMEVYAKTLHVSEYYLFDPYDARFEGYQLYADQGLYVAMTPEEDGGLTSHRLGLRLVPYDQPIRTETRRFIRWFTLDGKLLPTGRELADLLAQRLRDLGVDPGP